MPSLVAVLLILATAFLTAESVWNSPRLTNQKGASVQVQLSVLADLPNQLLEDEQPSWVHVKNESDLRWFNAFDSVSSISDRQVSVLVNVIMIHPLSTVVVQQLRI